MEDFLNDIPPVDKVSLPDAAKSKNKALCTNHPCALCDVYGHYSHHCPELPRFRDALQALRKLDVSSTPEPPPEEEIEVTVLSRRDQFFRAVYKARIHDATKLSITSTVYYTNHTLFYGNSVSTEQGQSSGTLQNTTHVIEEILPTPPVPDN